MVKELRYDLFSSVSAAKQGYTSIIDYDLETGENHSYMVDKQTGNIIPLIERGKRILEVPLQLMIPNYSAEGDTTDKETILYAFDIIKKLNEKERDFLIHARLGHLQKKTIMQMKTTKTAEAVHKVARKIQLIITARTGNKLLTWQFDRGSEFLNSTFEKWLLMELVNIFLPTKAVTIFSKNEKPKTKLNGKTNSPTISLIDLTSYLTIVDLYSHFVPLPFSNWGVCQISC